MKKLGICLLAMLFCATCVAQRIDQLVKQKDVERIIRTLTADDMQGRGTFTPGIDKAASFIASEFKKIGLQPLPGERDFRQSFTMMRVKPDSQKIVIDGKTIADENAIVITDQLLLNLNSASGTEVIKIEAGKEFMSRYSEIMEMKSLVLVLVDPVYADVFKSLHDYNKAGRIVEKLNEKSGAVFILGETAAKDFSINFSNQVENLSLFNVAGIIPGKSKSKELVIFSGHYDHLGIIKPSENDSIANGADDDASGITAMISLAKYYKKLNNNQRTLVFVAFTAEEIGGFGARYFSKKLNPDDVIAMFNIEMIGKDSKFGKNSAFITGYEKSDFGEILQRNLTGTGFKFYPDPYPKQNLFYRSDNATLAALGVPAHTISTDQIDTDKFYHTVNDEFETLDVSNIIATIKAIALSSKTIVAGTDTPKRIPKLKKQ